MREIVSIIVPVYNVEKYIEKCLKSIISQTYSQIEIIVVNDGSEENEEAIIMRYADRDDRIRYIKKETNEGLYAARITGIKEAKGKYIQFVDSDDYISPDFIRLLVQKSEKDRSDMVFSRTATCTPNGSETVFIFQDTETYRFPLESDELKRCYWMQHGAAYIWHTVWNKLYRKALWDKALPYLEKLTGHHVMTEDIVFSSILFYFANKASFAENATYFYCKHFDASTNSRGMKIGQYESQIKEVCRTFDFLSDFFADKEKWIREALEQYREHYGRMWQRIAENFDKPEKNMALSLCQELGLFNNSNISPLEDNYFDYMEVPFNGKLDEIKKRIRDGKEKVVSFDVFDTLITRPFFRPTDIFHFLDKKYEEVTGSSASFYEIRIHGEEASRSLLCNTNKEDITLNEIYGYISKTYGIPTAFCNEIMNFEQELELEFSEPRIAGRELYEIALLFGKRIIITSDMYLSAEFISRLLKKNGYEGYDEIFVSSEYGKLKGTGSLFEEEIKKLGILPTDMIHVGDNGKCDVEAAEKKGIKAIHLPKTLDAFCGKTENNRNDHRKKMGSEISGEYVGQKGFEKGMSYGIPIALAANRFFDNPFVGFNDYTDFNVNSYFAGYYVLGTSLIGQIEWLKRKIKEKKLQRILFTSRDGKLLMDAFKLYLEIRDESFPIEYIYVSRRSMLPYMLKNKADFFELPIVYQKYSPDKIEELLGFCAGDNDEEYQEILKKEEIDWTESFYSIYDYHRYMSVFMSYHYDKKKHEKVKSIISEYFSDIQKTDGIYDLGYSASIHLAMCVASKKNPVALFMHSDDEKHIVNSRRGGFEIESMINNIPNISGLMREFFFSDTAGSCIGYAKQKDGIVPLLENEEKCYTDLFPITMFQRGALDMVKDFYRRFSQYLPYIEIRTEEYCKPFESFLASPTPIDTKMFISSYFEDKVYGQIAKINVRDFWLQLLLGQESYKKGDIVEYFHELLQKNGKKKLAFFGTGKLCEALFEDYPDLPVDVFLDNNPAKSGTEYRGRKIFKPTDCQDLGELYIVVAVVFYKEIEEQLRDMGLIKYDDYLNYLELF